jgi:hypothetical protein
MQWRRIKVGLKNLSREERKYPVILVELLAIISREKLRQEGTVVFTRGRPGFTYSHKP